ncbi:type III-B CRISPR module RAMP protein Cmr4 [Clostridium tagluense]|uniref:type III-B CRISPR module RAMP protein Cmr4 n=1 Tax=Clostridium tagluense TaxID=360422 RepID=UPI001C0AE1D7|nr:type III-B CRISPR module RAMP protein Cmr4 [Clostridium tagluense]MBU3127898.1 type III-B CRISPR module RAMP protein Cmr4 [Clostridium tagluense]
MYKDKKLIYIKALTSIHAGAGQGLDSVDMPIQREKHSNIPKIEASSLKGSIKHSLYRKFRGEEGEIPKTLKAELYNIFGSEEEENYSSAIGFTDARVLFFPVKSATDIYKLVTCPYVMKRWAEDLKIVDKLENNKLKDLNVNDGECKVIDKNKCVGNKGNLKIILEEYVFAVVEDELEELKGILTNIGGLDIKRVVILSDSDFIDIVTMYTEIITRNKIDVKTGAAADTGLFTEEYLPSETILYFILLAAPSFNKDDKKTSQQVLDYFDENVERVFQVGGNATIGKGFVKRSGKVGDDNE